MLDPKLLRENPDKVRKMLKDRGVDFDLNSLLEKEKQRRELILKTDEDRSKFKEGKLRMQERLKHRHRV